MTAGDRVGVVGNSGNTSEPHLHIHAQRSVSAGNETGGVTDVVGVPMLFAERGRLWSRLPLRRNSVVRVGSAG
ncbi:MAG: hypothetical protein ACYDH5_11385 [Acidimicrobiales bacterium]